MVSQFVFCFKMFYPPKGVCFADSQRGPIVFTLHFIGVGRGTQDSKSNWFYRIFFCENVLSPGGRCIAYPVGVQLFLLMFYLV